MGTKELEEDLNVLLRLRANLSDMLSADQKAALENKIKAKAKALLDAVS